MYDPFTPPNRPPRPAVNAVDPEPLRFGGQLPVQQQMPTMAARPERTTQPQFGQPGFQPPAQWADEWAQYNSPGFQQTLARIPYFQRRDARNDRQQLRQDARDLRQPNALGPGNLPPQPQGNPALPPQAIPPVALPPQAAPYQGFGEPYPQGYPQYGKLWG